MLGQTQGQQAGNEEATSRKNGQDVFWIRIVFRLEVAFHQILFLVLVTCRHKHQENSPIWKNGLEEYEEVDFQSSPHPTLVRKNALYLFSDFAT